MKSFDTLSNAYMFDHDDHAIVEEFHEHTKLSPALDALFKQRVTLFLRSPAIRRMVVRAWKTYPGYESVALPKASLGPMTLEHALRTRRSLSNTSATFGGPRMTIEALSAILYFSYGITGSVSMAQPDQPAQPLRASCSAGGLYPLEIYPLVFHAEGLRAGLYHYAVEDHSLSLLRPDIVPADLLRHTTSQQMCEDADVMFVVTAVFERALSKYLQRGYRFIMNDAGALLQSLYLSTTATGLRGCAWGGFCDDMVGDFVGADNLNECVVICFAAGG
ncbi:SagB/ThcOx family dehydrogenase [Massilia sp. DWR3-1-1]|uniref:SagB/ThcOx family dehydrogenase n=1 Tax=Massilia sp. DWR3-1-1 TaxID=2804559 RepID=UPI003CF3DDA3